MLLCLAFSLNGCGIESLNRSEFLNPGGLTEGGSDIARTFSQAFVLLPPARGEEVTVGKMSDADVRRKLSAAGGRLPVMVYMHGCTGLQDPSVLAGFAKQGFVVVAPNSFARRFRPLQCRPSSRTGGENIFVFDFRLSELSYAVHRLRGMAWVDPDRMILFGVSEGGVAAALYRGNEFNGRIIAQWTCHGHPFVRGIAAPAGEPILAVVRKGDPWYDRARTRGQEGDCGAFFGDRPRSRSIVLDGAPGHVVLRDPRVLAAMREFSFREGRLGQ
jgi:dienelactone hydrolase